MSQDGSLGAKRSKNQPKSALEILKTDTRLKVIRERLADHELAFVAETFDQATDFPSRWIRKPQGEREEWLKKFEAAVSQLADLMIEGPLSPEGKEPEGYGFPIRDYVLMRLLKRIGYPVPDDKNSQDFHRLMYEANTAADAEDWRILDVLADYRDVTRAMYSKQPLKKPRDKKASRGRFIVLLARHTELSVADIVLIGHVLFQDDSINAQLVKRFIRNSK
jgi:hypothetical protein